MSGKCKGKVDRRVRRTRESLGSAFVELIEESSFEEITVQQILDRADVARSTFYEHFRDKDDLFLSDAERMLEHMARTIEPTDRLVPLRELLEHLKEVEGFYRSLEHSPVLHEVLDLVEAYFVRMIARKLDTNPRANGISATTRSFLATTHGRAALATLEWWLDGGMQQDPERVDALFHQMIWTGIDGTTG